VPPAPRAPGRAPALGPGATTQIDGGSRLSAGHDAQPEPTRYPEDTGLTRPRPAPAPPSARTVFDHANRRWVAPVCGPRCSAGTDAVPRRHGSHTAPAPPRHHPALGPCSTTQIDDGSRLSAGHDAPPEPTLYPEVTVLTRPPPRPGTTQRWGRVRPRKSTMGRACQRATMLSRNRRNPQKTRVSHGPAPPRHHPARGLSEVS